ncbi:hypothetical protein J2Z49_002486 [Desulfofundulus luciae]|uniref:Uncharacterized protein n=1 Tax=Desulfofundulus luciae TaxID=74702 RepID=A0ABU0B514_9FIRM|nr:hypothetical protein [Desulfofundulus luciae]MDQ0287365.1 hypothetical protein [Desulfofundulus luciae]
MASHVATFFCSLRRNSCNCASSVAFCVSRDFNPLGHLQETLDFLRVRYWI